MLAQFSPLVSLDGHYAVHRLDTTLPLQRDVGEWLIEHKLYSTGNDFTSLWAKEDPDFVGVSTLKKIWEGDETRRAAEATDISLFVIAEKEVPVGVVAWVKTTSPEGTPRTWIDEVPSNASHHPKRRLPVAILGQLMCFQNKDHRGKGLMKHLFARIAPEIEDAARQALAQGNMPLIAASDASYLILDGLIDVPLMEQMDVCRKLRQDVWGLWNRLHMYPEDEEPRADFLVKPHPWVKPPSSPRSRSRP